MSGFDRIFEAYRKYVDEALCLQINSCLLNSFNHVGTAAWPVVGSLLSASQEICYRLLFDIYRNRLFTCKISSDSTVMGTTELCLLLSLH